MGWISVVIVQQVSADGMFSVDFLACARSINQNEAGDWIMKVPCNNLIKVVCGFNRDEISQVAFVLLLIAKKIFMQADLTTSLTIQIFHLHSMN